MISTSSATSSVKDATQSPFDRTWKRIAPLVPRSSRDLGKGLIRATGRTTWWARPLPDYLIIGARRGGTTSLTKYLRAHPAVVPTPIFVKGVRFFDENYAKGESWYRSHFPTAIYRWMVGKATGRKTITGEASPYYLFHPLAPQRVHELLPGAKIVVSLRNPIDRAYSHWKHRREDGREPIASFAEAVRAEPARLESVAGLTEKGEYSFVHEHHSYVDQSRYARSLRRWLDVFPREQLHVLLAEDLIANPAHELRRLSEFLGLTGDVQETFPKYNATRPSEMSPGDRSLVRELLADDVEDLRSLLDLDALPWDFPT